MFGVVENHILMPNKASPLVAHTHTTEAHHSTGGVKSGGHGLSHGQKFINGEIIA